jgi:hypothetical protein
MLTADVRVEEFDAPDWLALTELLSATRKTEHASGGLVVVLSGGKVAAAFSTRKGRIDPGHRSFAWPLALAAEAHGARWAVRLERLLLSHIADDFARQIARGDDAFTQLEKLVDVVRPLLNERLLEIYPGDLTEPLAKERRARRLVDAMCPPGKTILFGAFENGEVATSIALYRGDKGFDRIVGPATARTEMGLVSGDWTRDAKGLARAVELGVGPLALGCFAEKRTWCTLLASTHAGDFAAAVAAREVLFYPLAPALAIPLGVDVGRVAVAAARDWVARVGMPAILGEASRLRPALDRVRELSKRGEFERRLGFDPFAVVSDLLRNNR